MPLHWNSDLEMGLRELDVQQQELFVNLELFSAEIENENGGAKLGDFFDYLDRYADRHFQFEDDLLEMSRFSERNEHMAAHRKFVEELETFKSALDEGKEAREIAFAVKAMMIRWLITHSKHMDQVFKQYLITLSENARQAWSSKKLGEILVNAKMVSAVTIERALDKQRESGRKLGLILVEMGVISKDEIKNALLAQEGKSVFREKIGQILVESGLISYDTLERALDIQKGGRGRLVGEILVEMGVIELREVMFAQAVQKGMLQKDAIAI